MSPRFVILSCMCALLLAGCASGPGVQPLPVMTFAHLQPLSISVASIDVLEPQRSETRNTDQHFFTDPAQAVQTYLGRRFKASGYGDGQLFIEIEEAQVETQYAPSQTQMGQWLGLDGVDRYIVSVRLRLEHRDGLGAVHYGRVLQARRVINVPEHVSLAEREQRQFKGMEILFTELDDKIQEIVRRDMGL